MKVSKILSKRALSLFIVGLFVFTAFAVIQSAGGQAQASPSASSSFTFPYQYGTPSVPSNVGAQGIQGPTVPLSDIGLTVPAADIGVNSHVGPVGMATPNWQDPFTIVNSALSIIVYNGTASGSKTIAADQKVVIDNWTTGKSISGFTNSHGYFNMTIPEGYWELYVYTSSFTTYYNWSSMLHITHSVFSQTVYLVPHSYSIVAVNNGPAADDNATLLADVGSCRIISPAVVELYNGTGNTPAAYSIINESNGTAVFTNVNAQYNYIAVYLVSFDPITGYNAGTTPTGGGGIVPTKAGTYSLSTSNIYFDPNNTITATVSGSAIPTQGEWSVSQNTTVSNGLVILSSGISISSGLHVIMNNVTLVTNTTFGTGPNHNINIGSGASVILQNSTEIIFHGEIGNKFNNSILIGTDYNPLNQILQYLPTYANNTLIDYFNNDGIGEGFSGTYCNDIIANTGPYIGSPSIIKHSDIEHSNTDQYESSTYVNDSFDIISNNSTLKFDYIGQSTLDTFPQYIYNDIVSNASSIHNSYTSSLAVSHSLVEAGLPYLINVSVAATYKGSLNPTAVNGNFINETLFTDTYPSTGISLNPEEHDGTVATNDVFDTPSLLDASVRAQMIKWANNTRVFSDGYDAFAGVPNIYALHLTHSVIQGYTVDIEWSNGTFSNNVYSNFYTGPVETEAVDFGDNSVPLYNLTWSNNTFLSDYNNISFWSQLSSINGNGNAGSGGTSMVYGGDSVTWLNFVHNSVYTLVGGNVNPQVLLGYAANITDNVFYNNETVKLLLMSERITKKSRSTDRIVVFRDTSAMMIIDQKCE